jgi:Glycosyl hydrolase family 12./Ricin-type beta-trefoil lectin domain.
MKNKKITIIAMLFALLAWTTSVWAQSYQVFGPQFAWDNNFNNSNISVSFGTGSTPNMTVSYNFGSGSLYGYPACIRGWHYGWNPTGDNLFPMQVSAASSIPCSFSWNAGGSNMTGDFAYDMFLRWDNAKSTPQCEVMVWGLNNSWPIGNLTASNVVSQGGYTFDLWEGMNTAAGYYVYTFIPHNSWGTGSITQSGSLNVDMKPFFDWLQNNRSGDGRYNNSMYLDVVEAGLEITGGNGWAWIGANINATTGGSGSSSYVTIQNRATGLFMDGMGRTSLGSACGQWGYSGSYNQQWILESSGSYVKIKNRATGLYIDGRGNYTNGSYAGQWSSANSSNLEWQQVTSGNYVAFRNHTTGLYLDGMGRTSYGSDLGQWSSSGSYNQQWTVSSLKSARVNSEELSKVDERNSDVLLYPNPLSDGQLNIDLSGTKGASQIKLIDLSGQVLKQISTSGQSLIQMDVDAKPGAYIIQISNNEKNITKKLIVK